MRGANFKHGHATKRDRHPMYQCWQHMLLRCHDPNNQAYSSYGGRGIKVCERWNRYIGFLEDMAPTWRKGLTIERLNNDGDYEPSNCVWATYAQQANNRRNSHKITVNGTTLTVRQWEHRQGFKPTTIRARLMRGWDTKSAVTTPLC